MTGITFLAFELVGKRLEILKEAVPRFRAWLSWQVRSIQASSAN